ncbi:Zinc finger CCCH domain-containing protein ZFN-like [Zostera marina]|uniref:Zinc finger CCCH domain-containing protein ZFN-like n=1 Tax=Zostera marina TaxID=29655 RepID=A0A0K9NVQ1_ZOSMR|nr:Zinc finger CCCH domain-containing protein ZFN-like [Zostera marina]
MEEGRMTASTAMVYDHDGSMDVMDGGSYSFYPRIVDEDAMWEMNMKAQETMEAGLYPERPGEQDCNYYIRSGFCKFGMTCKFNHPVNRKLAVLAARMKGGYPERIGQPECQYYLKTGTCKFGATCKFHHPKDKAGIAGRAQLNNMGYPIRPNEPECTYYLRTGECKFGNTCKFHHPQPFNSMVSFNSSSIYPAAHSSTTPDQQSYTGATDWPIARTSYIPSPSWQAPSNYTQMILPQGMMQVPGWNSYPGQFGSFSSPENNQQQTVGNDQSRDGIFPERPGEPECVFYMKTGDCKYGATCKFHHPRERLYSLPDCDLNPIGLPLRSGEPLCIFYCRYGICKFGPNCKFDHPMNTTSMYDLASPTSIDVPVTLHNKLSPPSRATVLPPSSEGDVEDGNDKLQQLSNQELLESEKMGSADDDKIEAVVSQGKTGQEQISSFP